MKRIFKISFLAFATIFALQSCGGKTEKVEETTTTEEVMDMEGEINEEDIPMDIVVAYYEDTYFVEEDFFCNI